LRQLYPDIQQEVFIKKAGRRVDFVIDGIIIQYNGARRHYVADDDGKLHRSVKERLALKTLKQVVCIDRATWNARGNNKDAEDDFLRGLIEKAKQDQAKKASSDEDEVIKPFFDRTAKEQVPVFHCRGSEEKKVAFA